MSVCISFTYLGVKWVCEVRRESRGLRAGATCYVLGADRGVEKMALMSHKISNFQLISIVQFFIYAATRGAAFLSGASGREFCQKRPKNLDISPFFSTLARQLKTHLHVNAFTLTAGCFVDRPKT